MNEGREALFLFGKADTLPNATVFLNGLEKGLKLRSGVLPTSVSIEFTFDAEGGEGKEVFGYFNHNYKK